MQNNSVLVSVAMTTYNHEKFLEEAINSVISQVTDFEYELILGEDCSKDNTRMICQKYEALYPEKIKVIYHENNVGLRKNNITVWNSCTGKYIAYCEGDDAWTDQYKLQKQIDLLEKDDTLSGCFHKVELMYEDNSKNTFMPDFHAKSRLNFEENVNRWIVGTCSLVFVNFFKDTKYKELNTEFQKHSVYHADRPLMAFLTYIGDFIYIEECMGIWRQHETNMTKIGNLSKMYSQGGDSYSLMKKPFKKHSKTLSEVVIQWYLWASENDYQNKNYIYSVQNNLLALKNIRTFLGIKNYIKCSLFILLNKKIYA